MISFHHTARTLKRWMLGKASAPLEAVAKKTWQIAPAHVSTSRRAIFMPNQLDRISAWKFSVTDPRPQLLGGTEITHAATKAHLLENAVIADGTIFSGPWHEFLEARKTRSALHGIDTELDTASLACTANGNRYFGNWIMDDCPLYPLANAEGQPIGNFHARTPHQLAYEAKFDMHVTRMHAAHVKKLVVFEDYGQNPSKHARFRELGAKLLLDVDSHSHPGVFVLRGHTGDRRVMINELEIAEMLKEQRGFRIIDPIMASLQEIIECCAGAKVVAGVEGSHLLNGIIVLPMGGTLLAFQPPNRFVTVLKDLMDRDDQNFAFVVGIPQGEDFHIDADEVLHTLDMLPAD
jgi:hypothetical protein